MNFLIEIAERNVMFVLCRRFIVNLLFAQSNAILCPLSKFINFIHLEQIGRFLVGNFRGRIDAIHACNWMLENELGVLEQLPQMIFGWIPRWEGVIEICDSSVRANKWMEQLALKYYRLQDKVKAIIKWFRLKDSQPYALELRLSWGNLLEAKC